MHLGLTPVSWTRYARVGAVAAITYGSLLGPQGVTAAPKTVTLARPGIKFSLPAEWKRESMEHHERNTDFSPAFPEGGVARYTNGSEVLVLAYLIFDAQNPAAQRRHHSSLEGKRRSKSLKRAYRRRGIEILEYESHRQKPLGILRGVFFAKGRVDVEITALVNGERAVAGRRMRGLAPVFAGIVNTIAITGPTQEIRKRSPAGR